MELLATAHTWRGGDGSFSITPVVGLLLTLFLIRFLLRLPIGPVAGAVSVVAGALFATLGGRWGYSATSAFWILCCALCASVRRGAGPLRRNPSD
jgi:hypothetical protein